VTTKIGGFDNRPVQLGSAKSATRPREASGSVATRSATISTAVRITGQARQLAALEQALRNIPAADEARVAEIRAAIEEGRYEVVPERIAEKLIALERDLRTVEK